MQLLDYPATTENIVYFLNKLKCEKCGKCCQGPVILRDNETDLLANALNLSKHSFKDRYTFFKDGHRFLNNPCPFYKEGCTIYLNRPQVCRQFPFNQVVKGKMTIQDCPAGNKVR